MTSEKRSSYLNLAKLVGFFSLYIWKLYQIRKCILICLIPYSYSTFFKKNGGGHKIKSGHKEVWEGGGDGAVHQNLFIKKIFINKAVQTKSLYLYEAPRSISIWLNSIRQYLIKQKDR